MVLYTTLCTRNEYFFRSILSLWFIKKNTLNSVCCMWLEKPLNHKHKKSLLKKVLTYIHTYLNISVCFFIIFMNNVPCFIAVKWDLMHFMAYLLTYRLDKHSWNIWDCENSWRSLLDWRRQCSFQFGLRIIWGSKWNDNFLVGQVLIKYVSFFIVSSKSKAHNLSLNAFF